MKIPRPPLPALLGLLAVLPVSGQMTSNDVATVIAQAAARAAAVSPNAVIAVVDREGFVLGAWSVNGAAPGALDLEDAITKAGSAAFLSSDQHAFSSRTAGFIVQQHFPPGIVNRPNGPLVGVNFSNLSFTDVNRFKDPHTAVLGLNSGTNGTAIAGPAALSGLAGSPGGVPLFKDGRLIGGVGVSGTGRGPIPALFDIQQIPPRPDVDEDVALAGQNGFAPRAILLGSRVFIDGLRVPYVNTRTRLAPMLVTTGAVVAPYLLTDSPPVSYPTALLGGVPGEVRAPIIADPVGGTLGGESRLTASEVTNILAQAAHRASITRAGIRLPRGQAAQVFITVVNHPGDTNVAPAILGTFRTPDATIFSWDVSAQKARSALFFSDNTRAWSSRTVGFLAQRQYPPGIRNTPPGPLYGMQEMFSLLPAGVTNILNGVVLTTPPALHPALPNGLTIFPGGFPLYRNGQLIGAIGVSGDGIDQDDIIAAAGTVGFQPPPAIRADQTSFRGARLPYAKFPRNPQL